MKNDAIGLFYNGSRVGEVLTNRSMTKEELIRTAFGLSSLTNQKELKRLYDDEEFGLNFDSCFYINDDGKYDIDIDGISIVRSIKDVADNILEGVGYEEVYKVPVSSIDDLQAVIEELELRGYDCKLSPCTDYLEITDRLQEIARYINNIKNSENIENDIIEAFGDYEEQGVSSVIVSSEHMMNCFEPHEDHNHSAYINTAESRIINFDLIQNEDSTWSVSSTWIS